MVERDIYEVANQLEGYVDESTPDPLASFLLREGTEAGKLADRICALAAENERLTKERDDLHELFKLDGEQHAAHIKALTEAHSNRIRKYSDRVMELRADRDRLATQVDELVKVLEPFSNFAGELFALNYNDTDQVVTVETNSIYGKILMSLTFLPFRNARALLSRIKEGRG